ncbi:RNase adaptor protein RapZ [Thioclava sp. F42-5]|uniref:RNase adapter RapZ n=1 Tax=unclassified Thioclava TaxID=2621713 RepID=UPI000B53B4A9|nr:MULTISPECIES: RNase adapter RapZ [unclassified Thioclava]OWY07814.1 RNase adaptor protein RapZ [Thioclava sp. F42-5]OWY11489.1 RNase adaptor protein RapZ [Thioclava sp. F34-6]
MGVTRSDPVWAQAGQRVVLVTGPSGAGRTTAIGALEDLGYEPIVNLPLNLVPRLLKGHLTGPVALGVDVRGRDFSAAALIELVDMLTKRPDLDLDLLYLDARPEVLERRYSETRRRHPLSPEEDPGAGIAQEMDLLSPIRMRADVLIDTSEMSPHDLRAEVGRFFDTGRTEPLSVTVNSFSYKRGVQRGLDLMFDCRFLANPHWEPGLRARDGRDAAVAEYVAADPRFAEFHQRVLDLLLFLLPAYVAEGKAYLSVGFGCTGGQHRSVAMTESIAKALAEAGWRVSKRHRELERLGHAENEETKVRSGA